VARLPDATLAVLPGCGHLPQVEDPAAFSRELLAFLDQLNHRLGPASAGG
jgi:pimeloyl-ACP methyl ester carboxylesterase